MEAAGKRYILHGSRKDEFKLWHLSDLHLMSRACAENDLKRDIELIRNDPYSFWLGGGDYADFIGYRDKRFDPDAVAPWVSVEDLGNLGERGMKYARDLLAPIKEKCLGLILGNHEKMYALKTEHEQLHGWLCTELGAPNLQYSALFDLVFVRAPNVKTPKLVEERPSREDTKSHSYRIYIHHGAGYAVTPGGKLNKLIQFMQSFQADVYFAGHVHDKVGRREPAIGADATCTTLQAQERLGVVSGSYLKTYAQGVTTYGEQRGYRPVSLGPACVRFVPDKMEMHAEI